MQQYIVPTATVVSLHPESLLQTDSVRFNNNPASPDTQGKQLNDFDWDEPEEEGSY